MFMTGVLCTNCGAQVYFDNTLENECNGVLLSKRLRRMFGSSYCKVIYYVIYVICLHYVRKP